MTEKLDTETAAPSSTSDQGTKDLPPEEGLRGWLCVVGGFFAMFASFGFLNVIGLFQSTYQETTLRDYSPSDISWIFAMQLALMWGPGPIYGRLVDNFGAGVVLYPCSALCVFALCMASLATEYYQIFLAQGLAFGIGAGGVFTTAMVCAGQWFIRRRGLAIGIVTSGSSLGGVIFPIFFIKVMAHVGFSGAVRYTALFVGILLMSSCLLIRSRLPRKPWDSNMKWFNFGLLKDKQFALYMAGSWLVMWGLWAPFDFLPSMAQSTGFSPDMAMYLISCVNAASIPGRILPGYLGDRLGFYNAFTAVSLGSGLAILALWVPFDYHHSHAGLIIFALVYGFMSGSCVSLLMPCAAKAGTLETLGQRFGTYQIIMSTSLLTGLPIMGAILARQGGENYIGLQMFGSFALIVGAILVAISTWILRQRNQTWKV
ncbi:major facilitator superfamily domain-containing protein [Penicillium lagena]|uniref:major facilitator superfamily domain-containing protein n=1 Tax=Penicillium lagena TaxID=94218 RepID=UPI0025406BEC|nr:major facilitator superfamily domain-containing protein [Penicillium lagena]KAJ5624015.1 major facilitator superfamily domain-containing protein [Penicillium lagena]